MEPHKFNKNKEHGKGIISVRPNTSNWHKT